jgi:NDP-sugar pyrophosphorylase family protein
MMLYSKYIMQAIILAGGIGSRLGNIVKDTPKPFLKVNGNPFILKIVERLVSQGIKDIIFCLGYKPQKIIDFFGDGSRWGIKVSYVIEDKLMGTAGAIRGTYKKISKSSVIVLNGDSFCYFDIPNLFKKHRLNNADATLSVIRTDKVEKYGLILFNKNMKINEFIEKPKENKKKINYINAGVYIIKKNLIKKIDNTKPVSLEKDFFPKILNRNLQVFILKNKKFIDIGTPNSFKKANFFFTK